MAFESNFLRRSFLFGSAALAISKPLFSLPGVHAGFEDVAAKAGVGFRHASSRTPEKYLPESMGSGVAVLDVQNRGLLDLFFVNGAQLNNPMLAGQKPDKSNPKYWNRLYRNNGNGSYTDVTEKAGLRGTGYGMGVAVGDFNNDGFPDLFVTGLDSAALYQNNGDGTFTEVTKKAGIHCPGWSTGACFVDYDRDGKLDLIVTRYLDWDFGQNLYCGEKRAGYRSYCHPGQFHPTTHMVFHNNGDGTFSDVSKSSGLSAVPAQGLGIAINDFDRDGWPDVVVANDSFPEQLFRNNRDGTFTNVATEFGAAFNEDGNTFAGMGVDFADFDNDGWPDIFINGLANDRYALFTNRAGKEFTYVSGMAGISRATMLHSGWGAKFIDYDNDGWKDLFVAQGHVMDNIALTQPNVRYLEPPLLLRNQHGKFEDVSKLNGTIFSTPLAARGAAFGDLNNDGSVDIVINCNDGSPVILMNRSGTGNHWLIVNTVGSVSNRDGIGTSVRVVGQSGTEQYSYVSTAGSYLSASDKRIHFGLGQERNIALLELSWPSGKVQQLKNVAVDQILTVKEA